MRIIGLLAEQAPAELDRRDNRLKGLGMQFLWHQADHCTGLAVVLGDIEAAHRDRAGGRVDDAANGTDQGGFTGPVGTQ